MPTQPTLTGDATDPTGTTGGPTGPSGPVTRERRGPQRGPFGVGTLVKIAVMAVVNALGVFGILAAWREGHMGILASMVVLLVVADWVYFSRRTLPLKYVLPGLVFLLVYQVYVVGYTGWVAFTNYGDGHNSTKQDAVEALLIQNERRVEGSATYPLTIVERGGALGFAIVEDGEARVGTADDPLQEEPDASIDDDRVTEVPGATVLDRSEVLARQSEVTSLRVPVSDDPNDGWVRTQDARTGFIAVPSLEWDPEADTMTDVTTGTVYHATSEGWFQSDDGQRLNVGWRVMVGLDNFRTAFGDERYAQPFVKILLWTFAFAILSVVSTFLLGLFLAITFNDTRVRGRRLYRTLLIFPYAIPGFLAALLWSGMLNRSYGFVNQVLLNGAAVPWLTDPWLAKVSVLGVNLWLGFPYMFLICTGALQSLPSDVLEAAKVDGAGAWRTWRSVTLPLLLVATTPLLISSFAFNFNNFTLIYMLTGGGPRFADASVPLGHTDILISMVYSVSGLDGTAAKNYGLASALSIVIFVIVATISAITFRQTRQFEEIN